MTLPPIRRTGAAALLALVGVVTWLSRAHPGPRLFDIDVTGPVVADAGARIEPDSVSGVVLTPGDGTPRPWLPLPARGARVDLLSADGAVVQTTATDSCGRFAFAGLTPRTTYDVVARGAPGQVDDRIAGIELDPGERRRLPTLVVSARRERTILVVDEAGTPIPGAEVELLREQPWPVQTWRGEGNSRTTAAAPVARAASGADGRATFTVPEHFSAVFRVWAPVRARVVAPLRTVGASNEHLAILPRAETVTGRVTDSRGQVVPRAEVLARTLAADGIDAGECVFPHLQFGFALAALWHRAISGPDGRFVLDDLPPGVIELVAARPGGAPDLAARIEVPAVRDVELALAPEVPLSVRAVDADTGAPVAGVVVETGDTDLRLGHAFVTGADGRIEERVPSGTWARVLGIPGHTVENETDIDAVSGAIDVRVRVARAATVIGRVKGSSSDERCRIRSERVAPGGEWRGTIGSVSVFADDSFLAEDVGPGFAAVFAASGLYGASWGDWEEAIGSGAARFSRAALELRPGTLVPVELTAVRSAADEELDRTMRLAEEPSAPEPPPRDFALRVRVAWDGDLAPRGLRWAISWSDRCPRSHLQHPVPPSGVIDAVVTRRGRDRTCTLWVEDETRERRSVPIELADDVEGPIVFDVRLGPARTVRGRVLCDGSPVAGVSVLDDGGVERARTAADGTFVAATSQSARIVAPGFVSRDVSGPSNGPPETDLGDIAIERSRELRGRVTDAEGRPWAGVVVRADARVLDRMREYAVPATCRTDSLGRFVLTALPRASQSITVRSDAKSPRPMAPTVVRETTPDPGELRIVADPGFTISGRVVDASGQPCTFGTVYIVPVPGRGESPRADAGTAATLVVEASCGEDGTFETESLAAGEYEIRLDPPRGAPGPKCASCESSPACMPPQQSGSPDSVAPIPPPLRVRAGARDVRVVARESGRGD